MIACKDGNEDNNALLEWPARFKRWRQALAQGKAKYDDLEKLLARGAGYHRAYDHA
jgi:hypothetical protein